MGVPFLDLTRQYETIREEIGGVLTQVLETQRFVLGRFVRSLEEEISEYIGTGHAIGVASGTDALLLGLRALGLKRGEGVITSTFTFFATAGAIHNAGGHPFFLDIDPESFNLSPAAVGTFLREECVRGDDGLPVHRKSGAIVRAILPVHLYGLCADMDALNDLAGEYGLRVLEDACQAIGSTYHRRKAGALGDIAAFSFFPTKNLGGAGDGGMVTTDDDALAQKLALLRVHGSSKRYIHEVIGYNSRLDELQAAVLGVKLRHLDEWNAGRNRIAGFYREGLADVEGVRTPLFHEGFGQIFHQFVIRTTHRDELKAYLDEREIGAMIYYPVPLHLQPCFHFLGYREGDFSEAESASREVLALPIFPELTEAEATEVCDVVRDFHAGRD